MNLLTRLLFITINWNIFCFNFSLKICYLDRDTDIVAFIFMFKQFESSMQISE